jgi:hypothetical protein
MAIANSFRPILYLLVGLAVGGTGVVLFKDSLPAKEGSPEERVRELEADLKRSENRVTALEGGRGRRSKRTVTDNLSDLREAAESGHLISPDDILRAFQPMIRDIAPIFDRVRVKQQKRHIDSMVGELTRKYDLNPTQREALHGWFQQKIEDDAKRFSDLAGQEGTSLRTLAREAQDVGRWDRGLDGFMEGQLSGEKLKTFKIERFNEKSDRVQADADMRVARVDSVVKLDDTQRDQVFGIMARGSPDYDPSMELGGTLTNRNEEMLTVLRPEQAQLWQAEKQKRRQRAEVEMREEMNMALPEDWDALDDW